MIETVGFVDKGDNPEADIVFFKRKEEESEGLMDKVMALLRRLSRMEKHEVEELLADGVDGGSDFNDGDPNSNGESQMTFDVSKLDDDARAAFDAAVAAAVEAQTAEEEFDEEILDELPEAVTKRMDEFQKAIEAAEARAEKAEEQVQKMVDEAERSAYIAKAARLDLPGAAADDFAEILRKAENALTEEEREKFEGVLKGASAAIREGALLQEMGRGGRGSTSVESEVSALAIEVQKANPTLTLEQARGKVWQDRPDLFQKYRNERSLKPTED
jgi:hypothetical protein